MFAIAILATIVGDVQFTSFVCKMHLFAFAAKIYIFFFQIMAQLRQMGCIVDNGGGDGGNGGQMHNGASQQIL